MLSNDSFQEFGQEHAWLFEEGRLIGGKPVPGIGWVFTPRNPVRAPSRGRRTGGGDDAAPKVAPKSRTRQAAAAAAPVAARPCGPPRGDEAPRRTAASAPTVPRRRAATGTPTTQDGGQGRAEARRQAADKSAVTGPEADRGRAPPPRRRPGARRRPGRRAARGRALAPAKKASSRRPARATPVPAKTPRAAPEAHREAIGRRHEGRHAGEPDPRLPRDDVAAPRAIARGGRGRVVHLPRRDDHRDRRTRHEGRVLRAAGRPRTTPPRHARATCSSSVSVGRRGSSPTTRFAGSPS